LEKKVNILDKLVSKVQKLVAKEVFVIFVLLFLASCRITHLPNVSANDPRVGIAISDDGFLEAENLLIPSDTEIIYFQFFLDLPDKMEVTLDYKWYQEEKLYYAYSGVHVRGNTIATLERNPSKLAKFPSGNYRVEVWFLNTLLTSKSFQVVE
jgi:hypothetical protein